MDIYGTNGPSKIGMTAPPMIRNNIDFYHQNDQQNMNFIHPGGPMMALKQNISIHP